MREEEDKEEVGEEEEERGGAHCVTTASHGRSSLLSLCQNPLPSYIIFFSNFAHYFLARYPGLVWFPHLLTCAN